MKNNAFLPHPQTVATNKAEIKAFRREIARTGNNTVKGFKTKTGYLLSASGCEFSLHIERGFNTGIRHIYCL